MKLLYRWRLTREKHPWWIFQLASFDYRRVNLHFWPEKRRHHPSFAEWLTKICEAHSAWPWAKTLSVRPKGLCSENRRAKRRSEPPRKTSSHMFFPWGSDGQTNRRLNLILKLPQSHVSKVNETMVDPYTVVVSDPFGRKKQYNIALYQSFLKDKGVDILQGGTPPVMFFGLYPMNSIVKRYYKILYINIYKYHVVS